MDFQVTARQHLFRANREKMLILPTRSSIQVHTQYVSLQYPRIFQTDLGSLYPSYRENSMEQTFWCLFACPCECGGFPYCNTVRGNFYLKITIKQGFQVVCYSQQTEFWETYFPSMNERQNKRMFFRHLSISNSLDSKMWEFQVCTEALISTVTASMFPNISKPCEPIPR